MNLRVRFDIGALEAKKHKGRVRTDYGVVQKELPKRTDNGEAGHNFGSPSGHLRVTFQ